MTKLPRSARGWLYLLLRVGLGSAFIYAGAVKIADPLQFADNIASFQLLPNAAVNPFALSLPVFEIITGLMLVLGFFRRGAALGITILCMVFTIAVAAALARGLTIDCGCFGTSEPSRAKMWFDLGRDIVLLLAAVILYRGAIAAAQQSEGLLPWQNARVIRP
jgi:putative oxidoreductase